MKTEILKKLIKEAVKEAIAEELKDILLEAIKSNKQPITESTNSDTKTLNFTTKSIPNQISTPGIDPKKSYLDILDEMSRGPKSGFDGEFKVTGPVNTISEGSALPGGQLRLDQIMNLISKR
jgi:phage host-nuclease inhibitor protein Gam